MDPIEKFRADQLMNISKLSQDNDLHALSRVWSNCSAVYNYTYNFSWLGIPIIQFSLRGTLLVRPALRMLLLHVLSVQQQGYLLSRLRILEVSSTQAFASLRQDEGRRRVGLWTRTRLRVARGTVPRECVCNIPPGHPGFPCRPARAEPRGRPLQPSSTRAPGATPN